MARSCGFVNGKKGERWGAERDAMDPFETWRFVRMPSGLSEMADGDIYSLLVSPVLSLHPLPAYVRRAKLQLLRQRSGL